MNVLRCFLWSVLRQPENSAGFPGPSCKDSRSDVVFDDYKNVHSESSDGAAVRALASHQCGPGLTPGPGVICVKFVVGSHLCSNGFSLSSPILLIPQKPTFQILIRSHVRTRAQERVRC